MTPAGVFDLHLMMISPLIAIAILHEDYDPVIQARREACRFFDADSGVASGVDGCDVSYQKVRAMGESDIQEANLSCAGQLIPSTFHEHGVGITSIIRTNGTNTKL